MLGENHCGGFARVSVELLLARTGMKGGMWHWSLKITMVAALALSVGARAEDEKQRRAREDLERQLSTIVERPPTRVRIDFVGFDEPNVELTEVSVTLDDKALAVPPLSLLGEEGTHKIATVDVEPGQHVVSVRVVCRNQASIVVSDEGGYSWTLAGQNTFDANAGIEVQVRVLPERVPQERALAKRFKLALPAKPIMVAKLDDGKMPEPVAAVPQRSFDAGTPVIAVAAPTPSVEPTRPRPSQEPFEQTPALALKEPRAPPAPSTGAPVNAAPAEATPDAAVVVVADMAAEAPDAGEPVAEAVTPAVVDAGLSVTTPAAPEPDIPWVPIAIGVGVVALLAVLLLRNRR